eukprot:CAMPEP_0174350420 /NCGR_PEP_ID=MMETSP0811_2-20130205/7491_1 /TAXON_ID=73025 ORGANISM="Eutreptiella gymnastica-like, Strain CCMP1594" /NCGR_SAMPLE_ID=MMETSP0811_2 /ASSEMBLY_ACC=CAM_ASM_000667 /LENGTH=517 /DNA_ID=CAMNT_0015478709 /DNA_START=598 /DNA_END=2148 /DNA_ORIENTATION=-
MPVKGAWELRCTGQFGHSPQCPTVSACTSKRAREKKKLMKKRAMEAATAATAVALIAAAFSCAGLVAQAHAPALQAVAAADTEDSVAAAAEADHSASPATPSAAAALPLTPPQKQPTLFDMFATPPSSLSPLVEQLRTVTAQQATDCVVWFSGQCHLTGKKRLAAYNQAQKKASDLLRTVPMKRLVELHGFFISQRDRGEVPSVPPQFAGYWSSSPVAPQSEVAAPWQRTPTLVELLAVWLVGPSPSFPTVCAAVHHFVQCTVNDARMCAKEIIAQHPRHRIAIFCALAQVQRALKREKVLPAGFQQVFNLQQHVKAPKRKEECHAQDVCKVLAVVHLLTRCRPDEDFPALMALLEQCGAPGMQNAYGTYADTGRQLMHFVVSREVTCTALTLVRSPMWALIIDGAHKKSMRGAPDILKARFVDMTTGVLYTRHLGLIVPQQSDFLRQLPATGSGSGSVELKEKTQGPERLCDRLVEQLEWLLRHVPDSPTVPELLLKLGVVSSDGASSMAGVRKGF